jgi:hypothetical protein
MEDESFLTEKLATYLCKHLLGLAIWFQPLDAEGNPFGDVEFYCYSASIISINGVWNILTAGHIIERIENSINSKASKLLEIQLIDTLGTNSRKGVSFPFDYKNALKFFIHNDEKGIDFGLILLNEMYASLLQKNGVIPLTESNLYHGNHPLIDKFWMLGIPKMLIKQYKIQIDQKHYKITGQVSPAVIGVKRNFEYRSEEGCESPYFVGDLADSGYQIDDIDGMSGGPIIGFSEDLKRYWIFAIQSNWLRYSRVIFGCNASTIYSVIQKKLDEIN